MVDPRVAGDLAHAQRRVAFLYQAAERGVEDPDLGLAELRLRARAWRRTQIILNDWFNHSFKSYASFPPMSRRRELPSSPSPFLSVPEVPFLPPARRAFKSAVLGRRRRLCSLARCGQGQLDTREVENRLCDIVVVVREDVDRHVRDELCDLAVGEAGGADLLSLQALRPFGRSAETACGSAGIADRCDRSL